MGRENNCEIVVTVLIITYNQKEYIRQAVESVLSQETLFKFEILIHDDASTDGTAEIIREYELKYPELVTAIIEENNIVQKGPHPSFSVFLKEKMNGKYITVLEGDDYWIYNNKLQFQVDFLESHPDYIACAHNVYKYDLYTHKKSRMYSKHDHEISLFDILEWKKNAYHSNALMFRKGLLYSQPSFVAPIDQVGDFPQAVYFVLSGKIMYFKKPMSVYRYGVKGSFTEKSLTRFYGDEEKERQHNENYQRFLRRAMEYAGEEYSEYFKYKLGVGLFNNLNSKDDYPAIKENPECNEILMHWTPVERARLYARFILKKLHIPWREIN